eukprot:TRINITY_DN40523_c0_g1_i1.p2 TRINITY_DN40523_c0_g1~~TRINITY_DN40523_c0_g1_i1.p2  ORF type:complete len:100 (+),score=20.62 TRINITY_DN40523_c0_g1_i1:123-422(+)
MVLFFFFSSRRRHTRCREVSWARRCVQETVRISSNNSQDCLPCRCFFILADELIAVTVDGIKYTESSLVDELQTQYEIFCSIESCIPMYSALILSLIHI